MPLSLKEPLNDRNWEKLSGSSAADLYSALGKARLLLNLPVPELTAMQLCIKFGCVSIHERIHRAHRDISEGLVRGERGGTSLSRTKPILMTQAQLNVVQVVVFMSVCKVVGMTKEVTVARLCQLACCSKIEFNRTRKVLESDTTFKRVMEDVAKDREAIRNAKAVVKKRKRAVNDVDVNEQENRDVDDVAERPPVNGIHSMVLLVYFYLP